MIKFKKKLFCGRKYLFFVVNSGLVACTCLRENTVTAKDTLSEYWWSIFLVSLRNRTKIEIVNCELIKNLIISFVFDTIYQKCLIWNIFEIPYFISLCKYRTALSHTIFLRISFFAFTILLLFFYFEVYSSNKYSFISQQMLMPI